MKKLRLGMSLEETGDHSALICRNIMQMSRYQEAKTLLCYYAFGNEVNLELIINHAMKAGKKVFLPVLIDDSQFEAREYKKEAPMVKNRFGIPEPKDGGRIMPEELDLIIVPGLAFDHRLHRIGFGAGYYDRYLGNAKSAYRVGAAYAFQIVDFIQDKEHDVCLDAVATERDVLYRV